MLRVLYSKSVAYMMTQISIHDNNEVAPGALYAVHICSAQTQLGSSWPQHDQVLAVDFLQIFGHVQRSVRAAIIDYDDLEL